MVFVLLQPLLSQVRSILSSKCNIRSLLLVLAMLISRFEMSEGPQKSGLKALGRKKVFKLICVYKCNKARSFETRDLYTFLSAQKAKCSIRIHQLTSSQMLYPKTKSTQMQSEKLSPFKKKAWT